MRPEKTLEKSVVSINVHIKLMFSDILLPEKHKKNLVVEIIFTQKSFKMNYKEL